jgi:rRNA-processing protein FCF1
MEYSLFPIQRSIYPHYPDSVTPEVRIRELCAQLLRAQHPAVVQAVVDQLKAAIDEYTDSARDRPVLEVTSVS